MTVNLLDTIKSNPSLNSYTKRSYENNARFIVIASQPVKADKNKPLLEDVMNANKWNTLNDALYAILSNPKKYQPIIEANTPNIKTLNLYCIVILALIKHSNDPSLQAEEIKGVWKTFCAKKDEAVQALFIHHVASDNQKKAAISWANIIQKLSELPVGSMKHLLLTTYVSFTRRQLDYATVRIYRNAQDVVDPDEMCYIHLKPPKNRSVIIPPDIQNALVNLPKPGVPFIHIGVGKTIKHYGPFEWPLTQELIDSLVSSLRKKPRKYLFDERSGEVFRQWCNYTLKKIFQNKFVTVNTLRHAHSEYINKIPNIKMSERKIEAYKMGHSVEKQLVYDLHLDTQPDAPQKEI